MFREYSDCVPVMIDDVPGVLMAFQYRYYSGIPVMFLRRYVDVHVMFWSCSNDVPVMSRWCSGGVSESLLQW